MPTAAVDSTLLVMNAASVTRPITVLLDSFARRTGVHYELEPGSSLEIARRVTELGRRPDVMVLADPDVFPKLLMPAHVSWYAVFGRNRMVLAYTDRSHHANEINGTNWREVITQSDVQVGRSDPNVDPSGYRTLLVFQLAERFYHEPGLAVRLLAAAPDRNVRPRESDQIALLQAGELDYIWNYESAAHSAGLKTVPLPPEIDLGTPGDSATYATASTPVVGKKLGDTIQVRGAPILFGVTVPVDAMHSAVGSRFVAFLLSSDGRRILRSQQMDALYAPYAVGTGIPAQIDASLRGR